MIRVVRELCFRSLFIGLDISFIVYAKSRMDGTANPGMKQTGPTTAKPGGPDDYV